MTAKYPPIQFRLPTVLYEQLERASGKGSASEKAKGIVLEWLLRQTNPGISMGAAQVGTAGTMTTGTASTVKVTAGSSVGGVSTEAVKPKKKLMRRKPLEIADEIIKKREKSDTEIKGGWKAGTGLLGEPDIDMMTGEPRLADASPWFENGEWYWIEGGEKFRSAEKPEFA